MGAKIYHKNEITRFSLKSYYNIAEQSLTLDNANCNWLTILKSLDFKMLKQLSLYQCYISDQYAKQLAMIQWPNIQKLQLSKNHLTTQGLRQLMKYDWPKLSHIKNYCNRVQDEGVKIIFQRQNQLKLLYLQNADISCHGLKNILNTRCNLKNFVQLQLNQNQIGSTGIKYLIKADMPNLKILGLNFCMFGDEGLRNLSKANWPHLESLQMGNNKIQLMRSEAFNYSTFAGLQKWMIFEYKYERNQYTISSIGIMSIVVSQYRNINLTISISNIELSNETFKILDSKFKI